MRQALCVTFVLLVSPVVSAETVTYQFAGTISRINFNDSGVFPDGDIGQPFSGWFSYSSDSHVTEIGAISFSIGSFQSGVIDDRLYAIEHPTELYFYYYGWQGDYNLGRTGFTFTDDSGQAFSDDNQMPTELTLSMFDSVEFAIQGSKRQGSSHLGNFDIQGQLSTLTQVLEPASAILLLCGGLCLRRKRIRDFGL